MSPTLPSTETLQRAASRRISALRYPGRVLKYSFGDKDDLETSASCGVSGEDQVRTDTTGPVKSWARGGAGERKWNRACEVVNIRNHLGNGSTRSANARRSGSAETNSSGSADRAAVAARPPNEAPTNGAQGAVLALFGAGGLWDGGTRSLLEEAAAELALCCLPAAVVYLAAVGSVASVGSVSAVSFSWTFLRSGGGLLDGGARALLEEATAELVLCCLPAAFIFLTAVGSCAAFGFATAFLRGGMVRQDACEGSCSIVD